MKCERCGEVNPAEIHTCTPQDMWMNVVKVGKYNIPAPSPQDWNVSPQREWQGLTDKEIEDCLEMSIHGTCRAIEAKLKEKNS